MVEQKSEWLTLCSIALTSLAMLAFGWTSVSVLRTSTAKNVMRGRVMNKIQGKCLCEGVEYQIKGKLGPIYNCHCSKCRRWHGAAFRTRASVDTSQFELLIGKELLSSFKSSENVTKYFCSKCGSPLHSTYLDRPDVIGIPLGALEGVESCPEAHIFVGSKASWYPITDDLPQHIEWPGSESQVRKKNA